MRRTPSRHLRPLRQPQALRDTGACVVSQSVTMEKDARCGSCGRLGDVFKVLQVEGRQGWAARFCNPCFGDLRRAVELEFLRFLDDEGRTPTVLQDIEPTLPSPNAQKG